MYISPQYIIPTHYSMLYPNNTIEELKVFLSTHPAKKLLLTWDLWAGKTTLTKHWATLHGTDADEVKSPTYTYQQTYDEKILHIDMWRMESEDDLRTTGILAELEDYDYIVVERPKRTHLYADDSWLRIHCVFDGQKRYLEVTR